MNEIETSISKGEINPISGQTTGQFLLKKIENDEACRLANLKLLYMMRFFLVKAPPVLTLEIKLANLCNPEQPEDFLYSDLIEFMGKSLYLLIL